MTTTYYDNIQELSTFPSSGLNNKNIVLRVDFNVPLHNNTVMDDTRLQLSLPTIEYLRDNAVNNIILISHLGRPKGVVNPEYSLAPVAQHLQNTYKLPVQLSDNLDNLSQAIQNKTIQGKIILLENIRFHAGEEQNDDNFAKKIASLGEVYINDAFGSIHRAHASTVAITKHMPVNLAGLLVAKEIKILGNMLINPERPFTSIVGGSKISSKIDILRNLIHKSDVVLVGGGMAYTFIKATGGCIGNSIYEADKLSMALELIELADKEGTALLFPKDHQCISDWKNKDEEPVIFAAGEIPDGYEGLDAGPATIQYFVEQINNSKTILWNGPIGVFEDKRFEAGSRAIAHSLSINKNITSIIGGGDSVSAINKFQYKLQDFSHISTGGGASLEFLSGIELPGLKALVK